MSDIRYRWLWSCSLLASLGTDLVLWWLFVMSTSELHYSEIHKEGNSLALLLRLLSNTQKAISVRRIRTFLPFPWLTKADDSLRNTFEILEVPCEPCLLLCPQTVLLDLAFADSAFAAPDLNSPEQLFGLRIHPEQNQQPVPWKDTKLKVPLFCQSELMVHRVQMSCDQDFPDSTLHPCLKTLGDVTSIEPSVGTYCFRRGNGEALDNSSRVSYSIHSPRRDYS